MPGALTLPHVANVGFMCIMGGFDYGEDWTVCFCVFLVFHSMRFPCSLHFCCAPLVKQIFAFATHFSIQVCGFPMVFHAVVYSVKRNTQMLQMLSCEAFAIDIHRGKFLQML